MNNQDLTREQVARVCSMEGVTLHESWDGVSEEIPVMYPNPYNPWTSTKATVEYSKVKEYYVKNVLNANSVHPCD